MTGAVSNLRPCSLPIAGRDIRCTLDSVLAARAQQDIRPIGVALLVGEEIMAARVGHLRAQKKAIDEALREAERACSPISRAGGQL